MKELGKHSENGSEESKQISEALKEMKTVTIFINELKRRREVMSIVSELEKRIENWKGCDLRCYGELKLDDTLTLIGVNKQVSDFCFVFFLFYQKYKI